MFMKKFEIQIKKNRFVSIFFKEHDDFILKPQRVACDKVHTWICIGDSIINLQYKSLRAKSDNLRKI